MEISKDFVVRFIKTRDGLGVTPLELVRSKSQVDIDKYIKLMGSSLSHIFNVMGISDDDLIGSDMPKTLDEFFNF